MFKPSTKVLSAKPIFSIFPQPSSAFHFLGSLLHFSGQLRYFFCGQLFPFSSNWTTSSFSPGSLSKIQAPHADPGSSDFWAAVCFWGRSVLSFSGCLCSLGIPYWTQPPFSSRAATREGLGILPTLG